MRNYMKEYFTLCLLCLICGCSNETLCKMGFPLESEGIKDFISLTRNSKNQEYYDCIKKQTHLVGQEEMLRLALDFKDLSMVNSEINQTSLSLASNFDEILEAFKKSGFTINNLKLSNQNSKQLSLFFAIASEDTKTVQKLIDEGISVHQAIAGRYPINTASKTGNADIIRILLKKNANPVIYDEIGFNCKNPLLWAVSSKSRAAVELILRQPKVKVDSYQWLTKYVADGVTPLMHAVDDNNFEIAKLLLDHHANPNQRGNIFIKDKENLNYASLPSTSFDLISGTTKYPLKGETPLSIAIRHSNLDMIKLLVRHGARVNYKYESYYPTQEKTPLDLAYEIGNDDIINFLLEENAHRSNY